MKTLKLALLLLMPAGAVSAQHPSASKAPAGRMLPTKLVAVAPQPEVLQVGDTCYVTSKALHLRARPGVDSEVIMAFEHNDKLVIIEIINKKWMLIEHYSGDVGVRGYVASNFIAKKYK